MEQRILYFGAAFLPQFAIILLFFVAVAFALLMLRERSRARRELGRQAYIRLQTEIERLTASAVQTHDTARQHLASVISVKAATEEEANRFQQQLSSSRQEFEQLLAEVRRVSQQVAKLAPAPEDAEWTSPDALLRQAREAGDWSQAAAYLARINATTATSKNLEAAGDICRDHGFFAKAVDLYREAAARDPENLSARSQLLALSAQISPAERDDSLRQLQEMVTQTLLDGGNGAPLQARFFTTLTDLGRQKEMIDFCEALLKLPLPPAAQTTLHRHLAGFYRSLGRPDTALAHCEAALKLSGDDTTVLSLYAQLLLNARKYDEAFRTALRNLQRDPTAARNYILIAEVQEKRVGRPAARDLLQKAAQWADATELCEIEGHLRRLNALDELSEILPSTQPQLIQA
jgi:tetratricopeptide (TPR) repeat protein